MVVAFTGHRPSKLGGYDYNSPINLNIREYISNIIQEVKASKVISGMALGVDQFAADSAQDLGIPWVAAIPFKGQETAWPASSQKLYHDLLETAEEKVIVCEGKYAPHKMQIRNEWMVDRADIVVAIWDGSKGGTANCVAYAKSKNKRLIVTAPLECKPLTGRSAYLQTC